jgi:CBS domain-containing protein
MSLAGPDSAHDVVVVHLSNLLDRQIRPPGGEGIGKLDDVIVRLRGRDYPLVTGLVAKVGGRRVHVPVAGVVELSDQQIVLARAKLDLRSFERRDGEVLLREDILGHRLIDVADAELIRAWDVELQQTGEGWVLVRLDTRRPARLFGLLRQGGGHPAKDWKAFEPLVGHAPTSVARLGFGRVRRLKPAQIADLLEEASGEEGEEILDAVHVDPDLEADVFEELDPDMANRFFGDKSDTEVADVVAHMEADDAADAIAELPQRRRQEVLDLLPPGNRAKVMTLLGFNPNSAGGLMGVELVTGSPQVTVDEALRSLRLATTVGPEARVTYHAVDDARRLVGTASVIELLGADAGSGVAEVIDTDPVRVTPEADVVDVTLLMADYNLFTIAVVDADNRLLGVITVDDVLEAAIPDDWRRREPPPRPGHATGSESPAASPVSPPDRGEGGHD